jgi:hypothetical protein
MKRGKRIALISTATAALAFFGVVLLNGAPGQGNLSTVASARAALEEGGSQGDLELAKLLVELELKTRGVIAGHYGREQKKSEEETGRYKDFLISNLILPAAVADAIFAETVPAVTGGRAWVKMVVDDPRNPNNRADDTAMELMAEIKGGAASAERLVDGAWYYGKPIKTKKACLVCHGEKKGEPDPYFPQYKMNGWGDSEVIGAVVSRVTSQ